MNHHTACPRALYGCNDKCTAHKCMCLKAPYDLNIDAIAKRGWIMSAILDERNRQDALKASGKFPWTCADDAPLAAKVVVILEELGEVGRAVNDGDMENLKEELIQVAACCLAFLESL